MNYEALRALWGDMCNLVVGCDNDGNPAGPVTTFGTAIKILGGAWYLPRTYPGGSGPTLMGLATDKDSVIANRDALLEMAKAIDDVLPAEHQTMQGVG